MSPAPIERRRFGPVAGVVVDVARHARHTRSWALLLVIVLTAVALAVGSASQAAVPFLVYGGL